MNALDTQIDALEAAYEYLLEYAAQGREDKPAGAAPAEKVVDHLSQLDQALAAIVELLDADIAFCAVVSDDISKTRKALALISTAPRISSELIDNLIASMHLKAVLTDLFLLSEMQRIVADP